MGQGFAVGARCPSIRREPGGDELLSKYSENAYMHACMNACMHARTQGVSQEELEVLAVRRQPLGQGARWPGGGGAERVWWA